MESIPESQLQQAIALAEQAAAHMKKAAKLAEQAAQLWQQALTLAKQEQPASAEAVQMSVSAPTRKTRQKQRIRPETAKLLENVIQRPVNEPTNVAEPAVLSSSESVWGEGDDWWKPRPQVAQSAD